MIYEEEISVTRRQGFKRKVTGLPGTNRAVVATAAPTESPPRKRTRNEHVEEEQLDVMTEKQKTPSKVMSVSAALATNKHH